MPAIIYQNKNNNSIYKIEHSETVPSESYFVDCDEDSYLLQGDYPNNNLKVLKNDNIFTKELYIMPQEIVDTTNDSDDDTVNKVSTRSLRKAK